MTDILIVGVSVVDFVFGVSAIPDAPEKYRATNFSVVGGGCGANAAVAVERLGGKAHLAGRIGDDQIADVIRVDLLSEGVNCDHLRSFPGGRSPISSVAVDAGGERQILNFRGDGLPDEASWLEALPRNFNAVLADTRWLDGGVAAMRHAKDHKLPGVLDAEAPVHPEIANLASHVAFSEQGLREFSGQSDIQAGLLAADMALPGWVCVTCGEKGVTYIEAGQPETIDAFKVDAVDTLGAGDIWHGAFTLALAEGQTEVDAIRFANAAAALKCMKAGGRKAAPTRNETLNFLKERS